MQRARPRSTPLLAREQTFCAGPPANGTMIYASGGKLHLAQDKKLGGGKMMSTEIFGRDFGIGSQH